MAGAGLPTGSTLGTGIGLAELEVPAADGGVLIGDGSGAPVEVAAFASSAGVLKVANGGTAATTAAGARTSLSAAASGSNSDITALTGITGNVDIDSDTGTLRLGASNDTILSWKAAATLHLGAADAASPVAQTFGVQGARGGTDTDVAGASVTIRSGIGTGAAAASSIAFQTPTVGASSSTAQTMATRFTVGTASLDATVKFLGVDGANGAPTYGFTSDPDTGMLWAGVANTLAFTAGSTQRLRIDTTGLHVGPFLIKFAATDVGTAADIGIARNAAGVLEVNSGTAGTFRDLYARALSQRGANGQACTIEQVTESHTLAAAATSDTTIQLPANRILLGVELLVTTEITGCTTFDCGISGATTRYGTGIALTAGTTSAVATNQTVTSATAIRFTAIGGGASFTAGVIRVTAHYVNLTAATS